ncbi:FkbM family methyltransferase [Flavobacterium sp. ZB4R12]|uniref:FkbM family methyltransferase n=1 Tax=Flavobacterium sp. ZB4R12 TaxID=3398732 RepID=UPI003AAABAC9
MNTKKLKIYLKKMIYKKGYKFSRTRNFVFLDSILNKLLARNGEICFVQIGGNDGINDDPLYHFVTWNKNKIKGFILEPVLDYFNELQKNYRNHPLINTLNLAIHNTEENIIIHRVNPNKASMLPKYSKGIASFNKEHHINCKIDSKHILEEKVVCISLENLIKTNNIKNIDLLQIDAEGYDSEIILNIDFKEIKPSIINFEYYIPNTMSKETFNQILKILNDNDYEIWQEVNDITAYQRNLFVKIDS